MQAVLRMLDAVDWASKAVQMGTAKNVPHALLGLLSPDAKQRERAYWKLDNHVVVQGTLYEAAYFVIPILIQMLHECPAFGKPEIYELLIQLACGWAGDGETIMTVEGDTVSLRAACRREIRKGVGTFELDQIESDGNVTGVAIELIEELADPDN